MMLEVMMMLPPSFISGRPYLQARNEPRMFVAMTASKTSSGYSVMGFMTPEMPAWLKITSILPQFATARFRYFRVSAASDTSAAMLSSMSAPAFSEAAAHASFSGVRPTSNTRAPSSSSACARRQADTASSAGDDAHLPFHDAHAVPLRSRSRLIRAGRLRRRAAISSLSIRSSIRADTPSVTNSSMPSSIARFSIQVSPIRLHATTCMSMSGRMVPWACPSSMMATNRCSAALCLWRQLPGECDRGPAAANSKRGATTPS